MADDYLNFHKLEATELPFTVARVVDEDLQSSPECQLPADSPLSLALPELPALPELVCDYNVDIPLIPPPYFCTPAGATDITFTTSGGGAEHARFTGSISAGLVNECDIELSGDIDLALDFVNCSSVQVINTFSVISVGTGLNAIADPLPLNFEYFPELCLIRIDGNLEISSSISPDACITSRIRGTGKPTVSQTGTPKIDLSSSIELIEGDNCSLELSGRITLVKPETICDGVYMTVQTEFKDSTQIMIVNGAYMNLLTNLTAVMVDNGSNDCAPALKIGGTVTATFTGIGRKTVTICEDGVPTQIDVLYVSS